MPSATLKINIGKQAKEYVKIIGKGTRYKRGNISFSEKKGSIVIEVEASDAVALLASLGSAIKQLRVVGEISSLMSDKSSENK